MFASFIRRASKPRPGWKLELTMTDVNAPRFDQASMAWNTVASYTTYEQAQAAVDKLSDERFPVENIEIVGSDLRLVEKVTGRLTRGRAAAAGAASGAWFGLFIGLLVGLFTRGRSEEHTSELQSRPHLVCRLLLEKKKK